MRPIDLSNLASKSSVRIRGEPISGSHSPWTLTCHIRGELNAGMVTKKVGTQQACHFLWRHAITTQQWRLQKHQPARCVCTPTSQHPRHRKLIGTGSDRSCKAQFTPIILQQNDFKYPTTLLHIPFQPDRSRPNETQTECCTTQIYLE